MNNHQLFPTLGQRIVKLRGDYGWTQSDLIRRVRDVGDNVARSTISRIENNERNPSPELLATLARVLGTSTDYLLLLTDNPLPPNDAKVINEIEYPYEVEDSLVRSLLDAVGRLSRSDQAMLLGIAERLAIASQPRIIGGEETSE